MSRQNAPGLQLLDSVSNSVCLRIGFILRQFQNLCLLFWQGNLSSGRTGMWLCEKESILTEKLENIKKEKQKAIVKNVGIKCGFMVSCGKDIYIYVSLFFLQIWKEGIPLLYVYCVSFALCCKYFHSDHCRLVKNWNHSWPRQDTTVQSLLCWQLHSHVL